MVALPRRAHRPVDTRDAVPKVFTFANSRNQSGPIHSKPEIPEATEPEQIFQAVNPQNKFPTESKSKNQNQNCIQTKTKTDTETETETD
jgi:hypothetical protein